MNAKRKAVLDRIESLQQAIAKAREYLESGKHADWSGFRPLFARKFRNGEELPPHKDWVKNVFLPRNEKAPRRAEKLVEQFEWIGAFYHAVQPCVAALWAVTRMFGFDD